MRVVYSPDGELRIKKRSARGGVTSFRIAGSTMGTFDVLLSTYNSDLSMFRATVTLTPAEPLLMPPQPWNIYPIDRNDNPLTTEGIVHAAQRGSAAGVLYFSITKPRVGSVLYFQNLTALNEYCDVTHTTPNTVVGKSWPGLGFKLPPSDEKPLKKGEPYGVCDAYVHITPEIPDSPRKSAEIFLNMLADIYRQLPRPQTQYRDWRKMAKATLRDLTHSPKCHVEEHGYLYLHPYTDSEYPDSMVQLAVLLPLMEYSDWAQSSTPLIDRLRQAVPNFFDPKLGTIRRYLSSVGSDKKELEVDSWYLYHPLTNLARLAKRGDKEARELFLGSLEFGIRVARHFQYRWPVQFHLETLDVITENRKPGEAGQTDVPGIYAAVMLEAWDLTGDKKYLTEARRSIRSLRPLGFAIGYQFNIVAIGILACLRLWKITGEDFYRDESYVLIASFFHNANIWECDFGPAKHFTTFMGVTCLHDGPYTAAYEEFEAYAAFHECLQIAGDDLPPSVRLLMSEYCRYALDHCWFYYPSELPADQLSEDVRNGHIDRKLAIPLEDLYADWQKPGAVGQEIYGAGLAFTLLTRSHLRIEGVPFIVFSEYPLRDISVSPKRLSFRVIGDPGFQSKIRIIKSGRTRYQVNVGDSPRTQTLTASRRGGESEYTVHGNMSVAIEW